MTGLCSTGLRCEMRFSLSVWVWVRVVETINLLCDIPAAGSALKGEFEGLRRYVRVTTE